jgi:nitrogen-specific signal transduction histidine kinase
MEKECLMPEGLSSDKNIQALERAVESLKAENARLQELANLKDEFVAKASHELRTPLTAIKEGISLLYDGVLGPLNAEQKEFLQAVDESADRLSELLNNILDLSKIEAGRLRLFRKKLAVSSLINSTINSYKPLAGPRNVRSEISDVLDVFADPNRIMQVLGNLFSNAVKFTEQNGTIAVGACQKDGFVEVFVRDDGAGIGEDDLSRLFQKFSQIESAEAKPKGTGLGLALCKELVELHGGSVSVSSKKGCGSTFSFTLPIYSCALAIEETFKELLEFAKRSQREFLGIVGLDLGPDCDSRILEEGVALLRKNVHRNDAVIALESRWVFVIAIADSRELEAIRARLEEAVNKESNLKKLNMQMIVCRSAMYPSDSADVKELMAKSMGLSDKSGLDSVLKK